MLADPWLERWMPLVLAAGRAHPVLEIGCGTGDDTAALGAAGLAVTAFDISSVCVAATRLRVPAATLLCRDARDPFPIAESGAGTIVASLSLHYFRWLETVDLIDKVRRTLRPDGIFLCRLNSVEDKNFGAVGHHAVIEPNYYLVDGQPKRFFDRADVDRLFATGWTVLSKAQRVTRKYFQKKALWEVVLRRSDP